MIHFAEGKRQKIKTTCQRCGYEWIQSERQLYRDVDLNFCRSCTAKESKTVMKNGLSCTPHRGEVDLTTMAPLDNYGNLYLPGYRTCGMADCVNRSHILKKRNFKKDMGILRGQIISFDDFILIEKKRKSNVSI
jgi:hypothetical protein